MIIDAIGRDFQEKVAAQVRIAAEGIGRYRVFTPFRFEDGDHLSIVLQQNMLGWTLSDEGHTYMHLTYDMDEADFLSGTRQQLYLTPCPYSKLKTETENWSLMFQTTGMGTLFFLLFRRC